MLVTKICAQLCLCAMQRKFNIFVLCVTDRVMHVAETRIVVLFDCSISTREPLAMTCLVKAALRTIVIGVQLGWILPLLLQRC